MLATAENTRVDHAQVDHIQEIKAYKKDAVEALDHGDFLRASELIIWLKDNDQRNLRQRAVVLSEEVCPERKFYNSLSAILKLSFDSEFAHFNYAGILQGALNRVDKDEFLEFCTLATTKYKKVTSEAVIAGYHDLAIKALNILSLCEDLKIMKGV